LRAVSLLDASEREGGTWQGRLEAARGQGARSLELRVAAPLADVGELGEAGEGLDLLGETGRWFARHARSVDLREARALEERLASEAMKSITKDWGARRFPRHVPVPVLERDTSSSPLGTAPSSVPGEERRSRVMRRVVIDRLPAQQLQLEGLLPRAAASQREAEASTVDRAGSAPAHRRRADRVSGIR
jgi:hypothetical protein